MSPAPAAMRPEHHVLAFGPYGLAVCRQCGKLMNIEDWAADSVCRPPEPTPPISLQDAVRAFRRQYIVEALLACGGNRSDTADRLGVDRSYLARLIKELAIDIPAPVSGWRASSRICTFCGQPREAVHVCPTASVAGEKKS